MRNSLLRTVSIAFTLALATLVWPAEALACNGSKGGRGGGGRPGHGSSMRPPSPSGVAARQASRSAAEAARNAGRGGLFDSPDHDPNLEGVVPSGLDIADQRSDFGQMVGQVWTHLSPEEQEAVKTALREGFAPDWVLDSMWDAYERSQIASGKWHPTEVVDELVRDPSPPPRPEWLSEEEYQDMLADEDSFMAAETWDDVIGERQEQADARWTSERRGKTVVNPDGAPARTEIAYGNDFNVMQVDRIYKTEDGGEVRHTTYVNLNDVPALQQEMRNDPDGHHYEKFVDVAKKSGAQSDRSGSNQGDVGSGKFYRTQVKEALKKLVNETSGGRYDAATGAVDKKAKEAIAGAAGVELPKKK